MPRREHKPSQEEDNKLFLATGFRYLPASERGFPYPWCAKKSNKGWRIREYPPNSSKPGVEIVGWRAAHKMLCSRDILLQRIQNKQGQQLGQCSTTDTSTDKGKPFKKRNFMAAGKRSPLAEDKKAVDDWFRQTPHVVKTQQIQAKEEEFQCFLNKKRKEVRRETQEKEKRRKREMREREKKIQQEMREKAAQKRNKSEGHQPNSKVDEPPSSPVSIKQPPEANLLPVSPIRRKHKKMTPRRNPQSHNSITLGEDPELDQMIEDIVLECTNVYGKETDTHNDNNNSAGVEFDGSAVSALREAARETLTMITHQNDNGKLELNTKLGGAEIGDGDNQTHATSGVVQDAKSSAPNDATTRDCHGSSSSGNGENVTDERVAAMIQELIGEAEQDSGCHFDGPALEALKEAAKELVTSE